MLQYLFQTKRFIPNEFHHSFFDIDFKRLYHDGFRIIITDLDNTLISYDETVPTPEILSMFETLHTIGFNVVLLSNNKQKRLDVFTQNLPIKGFANARKPLLYGLKKAFSSVENATKDTTLVIGDQLVTDIWGANRFGVYNILVNPLKKKTEKWYTKMNRKLEQKMLRRIQRNNGELYKSLGLEKRL